MAKQASAQAKSPKSPGKKDGPSNVPGFLAKAYDIFDNSDTQDICGWGGEDGDSVVIRKFQEFGSQVLPQYFKHGNVASFVRQLNMYGFHKMKQDPSNGEFKHELFHRGGRDKLHLIKRKQVSHGSGSASSLLKESDAVVEELVKLKARQIDLEEKLHDMKVENDVIRSENSMLWENLQEHAQQQRTMQDKMGKILRCIFDIFTSAGISSQSQLGSILSNSGLLTSSTDTESALLDTSSVQFVEDLDSLGKALDTKPGKQIVPWLEDSPFRSNVQTLGLENSIQPSRPGQAQQSTDVLRRMYSTQPMMLEAASSQERAPKKLKPTPGGELVRSLSVEGQDIANGLDQMGTEEEHALHKIDSLGFQLSSLFDGDAADAFGGLTSLDSLGPIDLDDGGAHEPLDKNLQLP